MPQWQLSPCFLPMCAEFPYSSLRSSLLLTFLGDNLSSQSTYKHKEEHRAPHRPLGNPTAPLPLAGKLPIYCHPFFPLIYNNLLTPRRIFPLTPHNGWEKPSLVSKQKGKCFINNFSANQLHCTTCMFTEMPDIGQLLHRESPNGLQLQSGKEMT